MPLAMELAMELCYPASEGVVGGFVSIWFNITTVLFLSLFNIPDIGTTWLDYVLPLSCILAIPFLLPVKVHYRRMVLDSSVNSESENQTLENNHVNNHGKYGSIEY